MSANSSRPNLKRPFSDDGDDASAKPPMLKRVRFPKGKKARPGLEPAEKERDDNEPSPLTDSRVAAKERAKRRSQMTTELFDEDSRAIVSVISTVEVAYGDNEDFVRDRIQIEPFNLKQEREEGYFDADMNFVEFVDEKEIKDAWLDSLEVDPKKASKVPDATINDNDVQELSSLDIGKIKRRIADILEPGKTDSIDDVVLYHVIGFASFKKIEGNSNNMKDKMSSETKVIFDQLTEDAMKLMENGEYDVYHEKKEIFERESDDDEQTTANPPSAERNLVSGARSVGIDQPLSNTDSNSESGALGSDYVFDESSR